MSGTQKTIILISRWVIVIMISLVIYVLGKDILSPGHLLLILIIYLTYSLVFITNRIKSHNRLSERCDLLFDNLHDVIFSLDRQGRFSFITPGCEKLLGQPDHILMSHPELFYTWIHREDQKRVMSFMKQLLKKTRQGKFEFRIQHPKKGGRWLQMHYGPMTDKSGHCSGIQGSLRDVSDLKEIQNAVIESGLPISMGKLALIMTLEITNPLQILKNVMYSFSKNRDPQTQKKSLLMIQEAESRIENIIQKMVEISQLETSERIPVDIHQMLQKAVSLTKNRVKCHRIRITFSLVPKNILVMANPNRLCGAFLNIILNAIEATDSSGQISVSTIKKGDVLEVHVTDSGHGIPSENLDHIFEPFYTTKNTSNALGLGLTVSQWIIQDVGGEIQIQSLHGHGTRIIIVLPIYRVTKGSHKEDTKVLEVCNV